MSRNAIAVDSSSEASVTNRVFVHANNRTYIKNPGYPGYDDNMNVEWLIESPPHTRIQLYFYTLVVYFLVFKG